jgi:uncharacterized cupredoxin-like copper-binding protein
LRRVVLAADINAFHVIGALLAIWAVVLFFLGLRSEGFPGKEGGERLVIGLSVLLVVGAIGSAIATGGEKKEKGSELAGEKSKSGKEGSGAPSHGGTPAPGTGSNSGQSSGGENAKKPGAPPAAQTLTLSADPSGQLKFDKPSLAAKAGTVRLVMNNPSPLQHNISIQGPGGLNRQGPTIGKGGSSQVSATVKAGKYTYYCAVPGHREAGMQGTLTVK